MALSRERSGQRRRTLASLTLAAAASFFLALLLFGGGEPERISLQTEVVYREGASSELSEDVLTVLGKGRLVVQIGEDRIGLGDDATVRVLGAKAGDIQLRLEQGSIGVAAKKRLESGELVVRAGRYTVRVLGTRFRVQHPQSGGFEVAVDEGTVEVTAPGQRWFIDAGRSLSLDDEGRAKMHQRQASDSQLDQLMSSTPHPAPLLPEATPDQLGPELDEVPPPKVASRPVLPEPARADHPAPVVAQLDFAGLRGRLARNDAAGVRDALRSHLEEEPNSVPAWQLLATAERKLGDAGAAVAAYRRVIDLGAAPEVGRARYEAARLLQAMPGGHAEAVALFEELLADQSVLPGLQPEVRLHLSRSLRAVGRGGDANSLLEELVGRWPATAAAEMARGELSAETH
jgi:hypothetical protein